MKDSFDDIGKKMPYQESETYLNNLIDRVTEVAISKQHAVGQVSWRKRHKHMMIASAAAVALLVIGIATTMLNSPGTAPATAMTANGPLDEFLNTLSNEEAAQLPYYEIEEIPEY